MTTRHKTKRKSTTIIRGESGGGEEKIKREVREEEQSEQSEHSETQKGGTTWAIVLAEGVA
jgi:hypothetical protein